MPLWKNFGNVGGSAITGRPVVGGSGKTYKTISAAQDGEVETTTANFAPQAGTVAGSVVGPNSLSAVNDFYKDWWLVNDSVAPSNGLVCRYARVAAYDGATRTITIDGPWNFSAETALRLIDPIRISILADLQENVTFTKNVEFDMQGHRLQGEIDFYAFFHWIRGGSGWITNGISLQSVGVLRIDDCNISRRDSTIYAVLLDEDNARGRCELNNSHFFGRVAGRRGICGWEIVDCRNFGVPDAPGNDNLPYTLVESIVGIAIVVSQIDIAIDSEFGGACFYSENSITGVAAWISLKGDIKAPPVFSDVTPTPQNLSLFRAKGAAIMTPAFTTGQIRAEWSQYHFPADASKNDPGARMISVVDFTGTATVDINGVTTRISVPREVSYQSIYVEGTADMTGAVTFSGAGALVIHSIGNSAVTMIEANARVTTGSVIHSKAVNFYGGTVTIIKSTVVQNAGAPVFTFSGTTLNFRFCDGVTIFSVTTVSVGTWTLSGAVTIHESVFSSLISLPSTVSGGTFTMSGSSIAGTIEAGDNSTFAMISHAGSGGTATISSSIELDGARFSSAIELISMSGTGGSATISGTVTLRVFTAPTWDLGLTAASWAAGTATLSNIIILMGCRAEGAFTILNTGIAGPTFNGPSSVILENCVFATTFTTWLGSNTITWATASLVWRNSHCEGLVTITLGTNFSTIQAFLTTFNGNSGNNSITFTTLGTRPATYQYWKCVFAAREDAVGTPDVIDDYNVRPASGTLTKANLQTINATAQATNVVAGTTVVEGVLLASVTVNQAAILVRRGKVMVAAKAGTAQGDTCNADLAGVPTQLLTAAPAVGIRVGRALEAVGTTTANQCYTAVDLR